jgi:DNA modification methylase
MIPQVAARLIKLYGRSGETLLDLFCGSGTSLVEARLAGLYAHGMDINPLALLLAKVKTTPLSPPNFLGT